VLIGVSRSGKTPTCLHGDALRHLRRELSAHRGRLRDQAPAHGAASAHGKALGLTISPNRLHQIRSGRRPGSRYASLGQCEFEVRSAEGLFQRYGVPMLNTTECSIEEIASRIIDRKGIERRLRP
jgi:regulator of PEP synthase PpsR (kinase-PPPase family)